MCGISFWVIYYNFFTDFQGKLPVHLQLREVLGAGRWPWRDLGGGGGGGGWDGWAMNQMKRGSCVGINLYIHQSYSSCYMSFPPARLVGCVFRPIYSEVILGRHLHLLSIVKDVKLGFYTVFTGNRTPGRRVAVHYITAEPRKLPQVSLTQ